MKGMNGDSYLEKTSHLVVPGNDDAVGLGLNLPSLIVIVRHVPSTQPGFSLPILQ